MSLTTQNLPATGEFSTGERVMQVTDPENMQTGGGRQGSSGAEGSRRGIKVLLAGSWPSQLGGSKAAVPHTCLMRFRLWATEALSNLLQE